MKKSIFILKFVGIILLSAFALAAAVAYGCSAIVSSSAEDRVYDNVQDVPKTDIALLLGTSPTSRITGKTNYFYVYRIDAAAELYKAGKVKRILISGDDNSHHGVDETQQMCEDLIARGLPASAIMCDGKGYRTEASLRNAHENYGLRSFTVVSQRFHNERAIYLADHMELKFDRVQAYNAPMPQTALAHITQAREYLARVKLFLDLAVI